MRVKINYIFRKLHTVKGKIAGFGVFLFLVYTIGFIADLCQLSSNHAISVFFTWFTNIEIPLWLIFITIFVAFIFFIAKPTKPEKQSSEPISLLSEEQFMWHLQQAFNDAQQESIFCFLGKDWVFTLFLTTVMARIRGVRITVIYDSSVIHERYNLLNLIGCRMVPCTVPGTAPPFVGALFDPDDSERGLMLTYSIKPKDGVFARRHACPHDHYSVVAGRTIVNELVKVAGDPAVEYDDFTPEIISVKTEDIVELIRKGRYYRDADIAVEDIEIEKTRPIARMVERVKVRQAKKVLQFYERKKWPPFEPASVKLANGKESFIIPPVFEENIDGTLTVVEGHSRIFILRNFGRKKVKGVVVRGVEAETPDSPGDWAEVDIRDQKQPVGRADLARRIDSDTHRGIWALPQISDENLSEIF